MSGWHDLDVNSWRRFDFPTQILMVANELNRAANALRRGDQRAATLAYARALELADLTAEANRAPNLLRELRRWRSLAAREFLNPAKALPTTLTLLKVLLLFTGESSRQIPYTCTEIAGPGPVDSTLSR